MELSSLTPSVAPSPDMALLRQDPARTPEAAAEAFEAVFASQLVKEMRNTLSEGLFGSENSDVLGGLFDLHIGEAITEGQGLGIKQLVLAHSHAITTD